MNFADLTDTDFMFQCQIAGDRCQHWKYELLVQSYDDKYIRQLSDVEVYQLIKNCKRIIKSVENLDGGYHD